MRAAFLQLMALSFAVGGSGVKGRCWYGSYTHQRCCIRQDATCWDDVEFTPQRCCDDSNESSLVWWLGGPTLTTWSDFVLWYMRARGSCLSSPHQPRDLCCGADNGMLLGASCWDGTFAGEQCCHHTHTRFWPSSEGDTNCWSGGFTYAQCCAGSGDSSCFGGEYTFKRCCGRDPPKKVSPNAAGKRAERNESFPSWVPFCRTRVCDAKGTKPCENHWARKLSKAGSLQDPGLLDLAFHLTSVWRKCAGGLRRIATMAPALVASVALHAALHLIGKWATRPNSPSGLWDQVKECIMVYREHVSSLSAMQLETLHVAALDEALQQRVRPHFELAVHTALVRRLDSADQSGAGWHSQQTLSFRAAFWEASEALKQLGIDYTPIQGSLIALLRYGTFPAGRLSQDKVDVVDNDAELMAILDPWEDWTAVGASISLALEARGWPPCSIPHLRKIVCFSLGHAIPCKLEIYVVFKDPAERVLYADRSCTTSKCVYRPAFPFQKWSGRMPWDVMYPFGRCRVGSDHSTSQGMTCPHQPIAFLRPFNGGEYDKVSSAAEKDDADGSQDGSGCIALPVLSADRDLHDKRNQRLQQEGLNTEDLRLIFGYARVLRRQGYASFSEHLADPPCVRRRQRIAAGSYHAGLGSISASH